MSFVSTLFSKTLHSQLTTSCRWAFHPLRYKSSPKTISGVKKRFRLRGSGSIKRRRSGRSHNTGYKTRARVNHLGSSTGIEGKKIEQRIRKLLGCY